MNDFVAESRHIVPSFDLDGMVTDQTLLWTPVDWDDKTITIHAWERRAWERPIVKGAGSVCVHRLSVHGMWRGYQPVVDLIATPPTAEQRLALAKQSLREGIGFIHGEENDIDVPDLETFKKLVEVHDNADEVYAPLFVNQ